MTDQELWKAIREDDPRAFAVLFEKHWSKIYTTAFSMLKDAEACSGIVHDIFLNIWIKREHLNIASFPAYLKAAARYHVYKHIKSLKASPIDYTDEPLPLEKAVSQNTGDERIRYIELENKVELYLKELPKRCQQIFILSRKENLSNEEIAKRLGISKRTVENQLTHALHHLRISMKDLIVVLILLEIVGR